MTFPVPRPLQQDGVHRLSEVAAVLYQAQHEFLANPDTDILGMGLGAVLDLVDDVLELLPSETEVEHRRACGEDPLTLLRRAEFVLTEASIVSYPPGTSRLVSRLIDATREMAILRGVPYPPAPGHDDD